MISIMSKELSAIHTKDLQGSSDLGEFDREAFLQSEPGRIYRNLDPNCPQNFFALYRIAHEQYQLLQNIGIVGISPAPIPPGQFSEHQPPTLEQLMALEAVFSIAAMLSLSAVRRLAGHRAEEIIQDIKKNGPGSLHQKCLEP